MTTSTAHSVEEALRLQEQTEPDIRAWVRVDAEGARAAEKEAPAGPLHGMPFGVKDIIDVAGLPTECGSPLRAGRLAAEDAWLVRRLRAAGAVPLGKTVTTEFAYFRPGPTRNPHHVHHTPGGSSSGSAAAVAAGVVPLALGSQTAGSLTRPAAYCGVAGYVAPVGAWPTDGIQGLAPSLDAPGLLTPTVADLARAVEAVDGTRAANVPRPRLLLWPGTDLADVSPAMLDALLATVGRLRAAGAVVDELGHDVDTGELSATHHTVMAYEAAHTLAAEARSPKALSAQLRQLIERGRAITAEEHTAGLAGARTARTHVLDLLDSYDAILGPAAPGPAPVGLDATGDPVLSRPWQLLGLPAVTVPGHIDRHGLPLGLQLIGDPERVGRMLGAARTTERTAPAR